MSKDGSLSFYRKQIDTWIAREKEARRLKEAAERELAAVRATLATAEGRIEQLVTDGQRGLADAQRKDTELKRLHGVEHRLHEAFDVRDVALAALDEQAQVVAERQREVSALRDQLATLEAEKAKAIREGSNLTVQVATIKADLAAERAEVKRLQGRLQKRSEERDQLRVVASQANAAVKRATGAIARVLGPRLSVEKNKDGQLQLVERASTARIEGVSDGAPPTGGAELVPAPAEG